MAIRTFQEALRDILRRLTALERRVTKFPPKGAPGVPPGVLSPFGGTTAPTGWLLCDGATYQQDDYPELFAALGTQYGSGGAGTFKVPDLRGRAVVGISTETEFNVRGKTGGAKTHTLTVAEMPSHTHDFRYEGSNYSGWAVGDAGRNVNFLRGNSSTGRTVSIASRGGGGPHNNLQPYMALAYIIKS